jgi:ArsR family transcriptional regulator
MSKTAQAAIAPGRKSARVTIDDRQRMAILKALGDPRRLEIFEELSACDGCLTCTHLRESMPISAATISHHLKELETAGLIRIEREGKFANITLCRDTWQAFLTSMQSI